MADNTGDITASRARELAQRSEYTVTASRFLSPAEQVTFCTAVRGLGAASAGRLFFFGGCPRAERRCAVFLPTYFDLSDAPTDDGVFSTDREDYLMCALDCYGCKEDLGITQLEIRGSGYAHLTHRDYLGSILGLGIERSVIGDIAVTDGSCAVVFVSVTVAEYIIENLVKVGRDKVSVGKIALPQGFTVPHSFVSLHLAAASDRADAVVAAVTGLSRTEAKELCTSAAIDIDYVTREDPDARIAPGSTVSIRGFGKYIVDSFDGKTRSGRLKLSVRKYV